MIRDVESQEPELRPSAATEQHPESARLGSSFVVAVQFLTRLPLGSAVASPAALQGSPIFFPLVGACIGFVTAVTIGVACMLWPVWLAVPMALVLELRLTGALHEDGVADFCDAFGGGWTRDEVLAILKDSRIGTYGALGLFIGFGLRTLATVLIVDQYQTSNPLLWAMIVIAGAMVGRLAVCFAMYWVSPVPRRSSLAGNMGRLSGCRMLHATLSVSPVIAFCVYLQPWMFLLASLFVISAVGWTLRRVKQRLGGITGDCLGFICYLAQLLVLLAGAMKAEVWAHLS